jgi:L-ascorbate metabolism protein UlaG (beta-lactamase superfamily)
MHSTCRMGGGERTSCAAGEIGAGRALAVHRRSVMQQHDVPDPASVAGGSLQFIGNATVSIRWGSLHLLTDPNFIHRDEQLELAPGVHATRLHDPAVELDELGHIDAVVLSHFHADHFDRVAERDLPKDLPILAPPSAVDELARRGFTAGRGLETWHMEEVASGVNRASITALPGRHGPGVVDFVLPDVMGSMIDLDGPAGGVRIYVSGDTLVFDDLEEIPQRFDGIDVGLFHLGGTKVAGIMVTMDGEQGVQALSIIGAHRNVPIHFDDYDRFTSPLADFLARVRDAGLVDRVSVLPRGGTMPLRPRATAGVR